MFLLNPFLSATTQTVLDLPFSSDYSDLSGFNTPLSTVVGSPSFVNNSLYLSGGARVRTGSADNEPQSNLNLFNQLYTISFDIKMEAAAFPTVVLFRGATDATNANTFVIDSVANTIIVDDISNNAIFTSYALGFDSKAAYFNVKLKRTALTSYQLLINDIVVRTGSTVAGVMDNNTANSTYWGFRFGQAATRPFYIKNFKVIIG